jgi:serine/threonine protein phosphatase PrpC
MLQYRWISLSGKTTADNRDYCGISKRSDASLFIIADGSTSGPKGGALAKILVHELVDQFQSINAPISTQLINDLLKSIHTKIRLNFPADTASYSILLKDTHSLMSLHAGDCRLGIRQDKIKWLTHPHTIIGVEDPDILNIEQNPRRHYLTKGFRPKRFEAPEANNILGPIDGAIILATDGFWADLTIEEQLQLLDHGPSLNKTGKDDIGCLILSSQIQNFATSEENIYLR